MGSSFPVHTADWLVTIHEMDIDCFLPFASFLKVACSMRIALPSVVGNRF